jgi:hypothetical protein
MFAATPYATVPFATVRVIEPPIDGVISEAATATDTTSAFGVLIGSSTESADGSDSVLVSSATFSADINEASNCSDAISAIFNAAVFIVESVQGLDSSVVEPSIFNAAVDETAYAISFVVSSAVLYSSVLEGAVAADEILARYLWEIINDAQTANWTEINTSQASGWGNINTTSSNPWQVIDTQD